jgi:succinyl-diaminopimelate desuccinylase
MTDGISEEEVTALLTALVAIPSVNPAYRRADEPPDWFGEERLARVVTGWLAAEGLETALHEVAPGRPNAVARLRGAAGAPRMIWEGHLDTVQVGGMADPFTARIEGGRLYGRGAVDDKGCLAMFMLAMRALRRRGRSRCDLTFLAAMDEEAAFRGVAHHIAAHPPYDLGIAGEPTGLRIVTACKGVVRWEIEVTGRSAHSSRPQDGVDALHAATDLLAHLRTHIAATRRSHPLLGERTLTCTLMQAGEGVNSVPATARLTFDFRTLPDQTGAEAWAEIADVVASFARARSDGARFATHPPFVDSVSMEVAPEAAIVGGLARALQDHGLPGAAIGVPFGSDASKLTRAGSPTVIFGPGHIEQAHADDEHVEIAQIVRAAGVLVSLAESL